MPRLFCIYDAAGNLHYFRHLDGKTPRIKFNLPECGRFSFDCPVIILKIVPIEIPTMWPELPKADRDRYKQMNIVYNPDLKGTPARIFTDTGLVEVSDSFLAHPPTIRKFLLLHEQGHFFYSKEEDCDLWALVNYLRLGYNRSMSYYALTFILSRSPENVNRLKSALNNIQRTQLEKLN